MDNQRARGIVDMALAMGLAGFIGAFVIKSDMSLQALVFWRCFIGALALLVVCLVTGSLHRPLTRRAILIAIIAGAAMVANWLLLFAAFPLASVSVATAVYSTQPFILMVFGAMFLGERLTPTKLAWMAVALAGVVVITQVRPSASYVASSYLLGVVLALGAATAYAVSSLLVKKLAGTSPYLIALLQTVVGTILLAPFVGRSDAPQDLSGWGNVLVLGTVFTALVFALQFRAIHRLPTHLIGAFYFVYPAAAILSDVVILGHQMQATELAGIAAILTSALGMTVMSEPRKFARQSPS